MLVTARPASPYYHKPEEPEEEEDREETGKADVVTMSAEDAMAWPKHPYDRARGEGWSIFKPEVTEWTAVGFSAGSCFSYLMQGNSEAEAHTEEVKAEMPLIRSASCGSTGSMMSHLAGEMRGAQLTVGAL